jgi:hypothetical protein
VEDFMPESSDLITRTFLVGPYTGSNSNMRHTLYAVEEQGSVDVLKYLHDLSGDMVLLDKFGRISDDALISLDRLRLTYSSGSTVSQITKRILGRIENLHNCNIDLLEKRVSL